MNPIHPTGALKITWACGVPSEKPEGCPVSPELSAGETQKGFLRVFEGIEAHRLSCCPLCAPKPLR